jgi:hypothetical protein
VHDPAPARENLPTGHVACVALVEPAGQACPAEQGPLQDALGKADVAPKVPAGHAVQLPAPPTL